MGIRASLWRATLAFRVVAALYGCIVILRNYQDYRHPLGGLLVAAAVLVWTVSFAIAVGKSWASKATFVLADVVITALLTLASLPVQTHLQSHGGSATLTTVWAAGPTLGAAITFGWPGGLAAAGVQAGVSVRVAGGLVTHNTSSNAILLLAAGFTVGYVTQLLVRAETELARAATERAAAAERERLAAHIHDGALQVLALIQRRGAEPGTDAVQLGLLAAEQELQLRTLLAGSMPASPGGLADIAAGLALRRAATVTVSLPAEPVTMPSDRAEAVLAAVDAALHNVSRHAGPGAHAWLLLEDQPDTLSITIRDDGAGFASGRLEEAAHQGRLGVSASIRARLQALGGSATLTSSPSQGTEVQLLVPR